MSTAVGTASALVPASWSLGPFKVEVQKIAVVSGDDSATITAAQLSTVDEAIVCGGPITLTAQPTISANVVTLAFTDPAANRFVKIILLGK